MNILQLFCSHKFKHLGVQKDSTETKDEKYPRDFTNVTHHLYCTRCGKELDLKYAKMIGGVEGFLNRG